MDTVTCDLIVHSGGVHDTLCLWRSGGHAELRRNFWSSDQSAGLTFFTHSPTPELTDEKEVLPPFNQQRRVKDGFQPHSHSCTWMWHCLDNGDGGRVCDVEVGSSLLRCDTLVKRCTRKFVAFVFDRCDRASALPLLKR